MIYISFSRWWSALWRSSVLPLTGERGIVLLGLTARCILTTWNIKAVTEWRNTVWGRYSWACARDYGDVRLRWVVFEVAPRGGGLKCVLLLVWVTPWLHQVRVGSVSSPPRHVGFNLVCLCTSIGSAAFLPSTSVGLYLGNTIKYIFVCFISLSALVLCALWMCCWPVAGWSWGCN